ncbi:MAG TPA: HAD hydrolase-like protein [Casimicrobiaceae bacterium]|nr:HAD hydrolase-like protein [Casimicrobiaceae bacterium]
MRTLLFDLDGTLTDNYAGIAASIVHALERLGMPPPQEAVLRTFVGPPLRETFARLLGSDESALIERAVAHYRERFTDVGWRENVAYEGIADSLAALAARGATMYVCTAKPETFARRIVEHFGFARHFRAVYGTDFAGRFDDKSTLLAHLIATEALDPAAATMIGDRQHDIRAARANGMQAIGVLWGYGSREELADADRLVTTPRELASLTS